MGQRQATTEKLTGDYKYKNLVECEEHEDQHVAKPSAWPPVRVGNYSGEPSMACRCELCGCQLVVYPGHATGAMKGIRVILPAVQADLIEGGKKK